MENILIVIDMQNDFITGSLGTKEAESIVSKVVEKVKNFHGTVIFTRDTHDKDYLSTEEGKHLPVEHCQKDTEGWKIHPSLTEFTKNQRIFDKTTFGSKELALFLEKEYGNCQKETVITLCGLCTDICVISNAMLIKAFLPEATISIDADCCAGVTPQSHTQSLEAMKMCQIQIETAPSIL